MKTCTFVTDEDWLPLSNASLERDRAMGASARRSPEVFETAGSFRPAELAVAIAKDMLRAYERK